jgi:hypothetical protein
MVERRAWRDSFTSESFENSPNDEALHARLHVRCAPYWRTLYFGLEGEDLGVAGVHRGADPVHALVAEGLDPGETLNHSQLAVASAKQQRASLEPQQTP